jgi:hypothetical protein
MKAIRLFQINKERCCYLAEIPNTQNDNANETATSFSGTFADVAECGGVLFSDSAEPLDSR